MRSGRSLFLVTTLLALVGTACADATGPEPAADATGEWSGPFHHPAYDGGSISLSLVDIRGTVSGSYTLRLTRGSRENGRVLVETSSGRKAGAAGDGRLTLALSRADGDWILVGRFDGRNEASGDWSLGRVRGEFSIER